MRDAANDGESSGATPREQANGQHTLLACGSNAGGQLGIGHVEDAHRWQVCQAHDGGRFPPPGWSVEQLSSGAEHTAVVLKRNEDKHPVQRAVWVCGSGRHGQLGPQFAKDSSLTTFRPLDLDVFLRHVNHSEAVSSAEWSISDVQCGWDWTMLVMTHDEGAKDDMLLIAAGPSNDFGQYGLGRDWRKSAQSVDRVNYRDALLGSPMLSSPSLRWRIERITSGLRHVLILCSAKQRQENGTQLHALIGWGATKHGQVVPVDTVPPEALSSPQSHSGGFYFQASQASTRRAILAARLAARTRVAWQPQLVQAWTSDEAQKDDRSTFLAAGKEHSALCVPRHWQPVEKGFLCDEDSALPQRLHLFGSNEKGQLDVRLQLIASEGGEHSQAAELTGLDCTWNATVVATRKMATDGRDLQGVTRIYASGNNSKGQLGGQTSESTLAGQTEAAAVDFVCGSEHVVVLSTPPSAHPQRATLVQGWGWNEHGNLSQGDVEDRQSSVILWPPPEPASSNVHSLGATAAATHVFAANATTYLQVCTHSNV